MRPFCSSCKTTRGVRAWVGKRQNRQQARGRARPAAPPRGRLVVLVCRASNKCDTCSQPITIPLLLLTRRAGLGVRPADSPSGFLLISIGRIFNDTVKPRQFSSSHARPLSSIDTARLPDQSGHSAKAKRGRQDVQRLKLDCWWLTFPD
jgi:hypothetical protein